MSEVREARTEVFDLAAIITALKTNVPSNIDMSALHYQALEQVLLYTIETFTPGED